MLGETWLLALGSRSTHCSILDVSEETRLDCSSWVLFENRGAEFAGGCGLCYENQANNQGAPLKKMTKATCICRSQKNTSHLLHFFEMNF
jgi:hypothetical protein